MENTRHLGVYGLIIENDKILLVKKSRGAYTSKYDLPGGSIEHKELPIDTLKREIKEETNLEIEKATILTADSVVVKWEFLGKMQCMHHIGIIYDVKVKKGKVKTDSDGLDSLGAKYIPIKNLKKDDISPLTYNVLKLKGYKLKGE